MSTLVDKIDGLISKKSLLKHPFYVQWNEGKLTLDSLNGYSMEYFQLVKAVPKLMNQILKNPPEYVKSEVSEIKDEEIEHIDFWVDFAEELGVNSNILKKYKGLDKTRKAIDILLSLTNTFEGGAAAMYALEKEIPKISETKIDGLKKFYGISNKKALEYFNLHTEADIRHANSWKNILDKTSIDKHEKLFKIAEKSLDAQNLLLDACFEEYCN